ncbi:nuclear pore complex protein NUP98A [Elysia marginata]|uniref:Nuclear pore complex protein NUP98A n=1 Tax=Elysia marginata TaxID=1093978 RepID=A0AAV4F3P1_9GAST|nr:nuclear pore complex protein NUP98A [Elysia marginata]
MWKNWNPFRRKQKDDQDGQDAVKRDGSTSSLGQGGKENTVSIPSNGTSRTDENISFQANYSFNDFGDNESNLCSRKPSVSRHESLRSRTRMGFKDQLNTTLPTPRQSVGRRITRSPDNSMNKTLNGVQGPLLSSPIVPQIRKALESQTGSGIFSNRGRPVGRSASLNYGATRSLTRTTAGQVPWVRLKRRESLGLSDLVSGRTPQSPNTVKLAAREPRHLPAPPSFKTTPVIVTTEPSRSRVIDTQTVVSALREKRKRFGGSHQDEASSEDSWQNSAKRRRQDSSQSNTSSVSIPPMPDVLPDLMGTSGTSLLHIENLSSQRPSTVPATVDPYTSAPALMNKPSAPVPGFGGLGGLGGPPVRGLGGPEFNPVNPMAVPPQHLQLYRYPAFPHHQQPMQQQQQRNSSLQQRQAQYLAGGSGGNINNSKSALRSIQSSLSSSLRTRVNEAKLREHGIDLKRIRGNTEENKRRLSFSTATPSKAQSSTEEPLQKMAKQTKQLDVNIENQDQSAQQSKQKQVTDQPEQQKKETTVLTPTKRKIAEGVMLRKQNMSITPTASPARPLRVLPASTLVSADDFESDRQQEYRRRVLDMLGSEDAENDVASTTPVLSTSSATISSLLNTAVSSTESPQPSANTINASLASLSKLVQSTTPSEPAAAPATTATTTSSATVTGVTKPANSLVQLLKSDGAEIVKTLGKGDAVTFTGKPLASPSSDQKTASASSDPTPSSVTAASATTLSTPAASTSALPTPAPLAPTSSSGLIQASSTSGFQVNFGAAFSAAAKPPLPSGFSFGASSSATTTSASSNITPGPQNTVNPTTGNAGKPEGLSTAASPSTQLGTNINSGAAPSVAPQQSQTRGTAATTPFSFTALGTGSSLAAATPGQALPVGVSSAAPTGGFNFGLATSSAVASVSTSASGGFNFATGLPTNAAPSSIVTSSAQTEPAPGFNFGAVSSLASATTTTAASSASQSGFTFGSAPTTTAATTQAAGGLSIFSGSIQPVTTPAGFQGLGTTSIPQTSLAAPSGFGGFAATSTKPVQQAPSTPGLQSLSTQNPASIFGSSTSFGAGAGIALTKTTASSGTGFGGALPSAFNFSGTSSATGQTESKPFTFGAAAASTTPSAVSNATTFGAGTSSGPAIFGGASASATSPSGFFATAGSGFKGTSTAATTATPFGAAPSSFGATMAPPSTAPAFGAAAVSAFGAATTSASGLGNSASFTFGSNQQTAPTAGTPGFGAAATPGFGGSVSLSTAAPPAFGTSATPAFGTTAAPPAFGTTAAPPAFGSSATAPAFGSSTATSFGASAKPSPFGAASGGFAAPTTQPGTFGVSSGFGNTQPQTTQASSTPFVFGASAQSTGGSQPFVFGGAPATSSQVSGFGSTTGAAASTTPFSQPASNSVFGNSASTNKPAFGTATIFGAGINPTTASAPAFGSSLASPPAFGFSSQQPKAAAAPAFAATAFGAGVGQGTAFGSGSSATGVASPFGGAGAFGNSAKPTPFGAGASAPAGAAPVFSFSGNQQPQQPQAPSAFGAQPSAGGFNFGAQAASGGTQPQAGSFNFSTRPSFPTPGPAPGGFNFAAAAGSTPTFNFTGGTPTATNMAAGSTPRLRATARRAGNRRVQRR